MMAMRVMVALVGRVLVMMQWMQMVMVAMVKAISNELKALLVAPGRGVEGGVKDVLCDGSLRRRHPLLC